MKIMYQKRITKPLNKSYRNLGRILGRIFRRKKTYRKFLKDHPKSQDFAQGRKLHA